MRNKYGLPLTGSDWVGHPLRVGELPTQGSVHDLVGENDSILLWTGGISRVEILGSSVAATRNNERSHTFVRSSGMIDLLPRGTRIKEIRWTGDSSQCVSVALPEATLHQLFGAAPVQLDAKNGPIYGVHDAHIMDLGTRLKLQAESGAPFGPSYAQGLSIALSAYVAQRFNPQTPSSPAVTSLSASQRALLADHIERNLGSDLSIVDLSGLLGYTPDHFTRLFRRAFGITPHRYVTQRRVEKAKSMLRDTQQTLVNVALCCGFSSQAHLTVIFKRLAGTTPGDYRKL
jgi:AraC family transcriptional regulator